MWSTSEASLRAPSFILFIMVTTLMPQDLATPG